MGISPYIGMPGCVNRMLAYDNLPKDRRQKMAYSHFSITPWDPADVQDHAKYTYGPDHPQAQGEFCCPLPP